MIVRRNQSSDFLYMSGTLVVKWLMVVIVHLKHLLLMKQSLSRDVKTESYNVINTYI